MEHCWRWFIGFIGSLGQKKNLNLFRETKKPFLFPFWKDKRSQVDEDEKDSGSW